MEFSQTCLFNYSKSRDYKYKVTCSDGYWEASDQQFSVVDGAVAGVLTADWFTNQSALTKVKPNDGIG